MKNYLTVLLGLILLSVPAPKSNAADDNRIAELVQRAASISAFGPFTEQNFQDFFPRFFKIGTEGKEQSDFSFGDVWAIQSGFGFELPLLQAYTLPKSNQIFMLNYVQHKSPSGKLEPFMLGTVPVRNMCVANFSGPDTWVIFVESVIKGQNIRQDILQALAKKYGEDGLRQYREINGQHNYGPSDGYFYFKEFDDWTIFVGKHIYDHAHPVEIKIVYVNKRGVALAQMKAQEILQQQQSQQQRERQNVLDGL